MKLVSLAGGRLQTLRDSGRVLLDTNTRIGDLLNDDVLLEQVTEDFTILGMPHVFVTDHKNADIDLDAGMEDQGYCFSRWGCVTLSTFAFFGFATMNDLTMARLLM
jgi:hypothetical protein